MASPPAPTTPSPIPGPFLPPDTLIETPEGLLAWRPKDAIRALKNGRWIVLAMLLAGIALAGVYVSLKSPMYTARAKILIERRPSPILDVRDVLGEVGNEKNYYKTQYAILKNRDLALDVIRSLDLARDPTFVGLSAANGYDRDPERANLATASIYLDALMIKPVEGTRLVNIYMTTKDPELSAKIANQHVEAYIQQSFRLRAQASDDAKGFLEEKLVGLKMRLEQSEAALNDYRRQAGIISSIDERENLIISRLTAFNNRLSDAETDMIALEAEMHLIQIREYHALPEVNRSHLIRALKVQLGSLEQEYDEMRSRFKPTYAGVRHVEERLAEMRARLDQEVKNTIQSIESSYLGAKEKVRRLRAQTEAEKAKVMGFKDEAVQYAILKREADGNQTLYDSVLQRMKEMGVASAQPSNVFMVEKSVPPPKPSEPQTTRILELAGAIGLLLGLAFVIGRDLLDGSLKNADDVGRVLQLAHLGTVPDFERVRGTDGIEPDPMALPPQEEYTGLVVTKNPFSMVTEAYRTLRTSILLSQSDSPPKTILITSAQPAEGKTTSSVNLSILFARLGARVLLVDADLRRPTCDRRLGVEAPRGLTHVLAGQESLMNVIYPTAVENMSLLPAGTIPPNPTELLGSRSMQDLLGDVSHDYDYVIIDASNALAINDAVVLAPFVDGVILVVDAHRTPRPLLQRTRKRLEQAHARMLGVILNRVDPESPLYATDYDDTYYSTSYPEADPSAGT